MDSAMVRFVGGGLLALGVLGVLGAGAHVLRRRFMPHWVGALGLLASSVVWIVLVVGVSTVLGAVKQFSLVPVAVVFGVLGAGLVVADRRLGTERVRQGRVGIGGAGWGRGEPGGLVGAVSTGFAAVSVVVVVAEWGYRSWWALDRGIHTIDSLWYHLPFAARWVQTGDLTQIHHPEVGPLTSFFPSNGSIFHALGMLFLDNDLASVFMNLGWLGLAMLAGWCIGRPFGVARLSLGATAVVCGTPSLMGTQPGGAYSDIAGIALLLAAVALVVTAVEHEPDRARPPYVLAAAAAGIAFSTKYQFIIPVMALTVGVVALGPASVRLRRSLLWVGALVATGSFWYLRTWIRVGNPVPAVGIGIGPLKFHHAPKGSIEERALGASVLDRDAWREWFLPGFENSFGDLWWVLLGGLFALLVFGLFGGRTPRLVCAVALVTLAAFIVSPALYGPPGTFPFFTVILRYLAPGLAIGAAGASLAVAGRRVGQWAAMAVFGSHLVVGQVQRSRWPDALEQIIDQPVWSRNTLIAVAASAIVLGGAAVAWRGLRRLEPRWMPLAVGVFVIALLVMSVPVRRHYLTHRYREPFAVLMWYDLTWARDLRDERIGTIGMHFQHPLYGPDQSNHVQELGVPSPYGGWRTSRSCGELVSQVNAGDYTVVAALQGLGPKPDRRAYDWLLAAGASPLHRSDRALVVSVDAELDVASCEATPDH